MSLQAEKHELLEKFSKAFGAVAEAQKAIDFTQKIFLEKKQDPQAYMSHNIGVAKIALALGLRREVVLAGLLHNVIENGIPIEELEKNYGKDIAQLVESKNKFEKAVKIPTSEKEGVTRKLYILLTTNPDVVMLQLAEMLDK